MPTETATPSANRPTPNEPQRAPDPAAARASRRSVSWRAPLVDIYESDEGVLLVADLPGVPSSALDVRVEQHTLFIEGRRDDGLAWRREFAVPKVFDTAKIDANLADGVLKIKLPRAEAARPRKIEVRAG